MRKTVFHLLTLAYFGVTLLLMDLVLVNASEITKSPKKLSTYKEIALPGSTWKSMMNQTFRFSFQVPASSKIVQHSWDRVFSYEYFRIQNYEFDDTYRPFNKRDRFWLEVFIYDRKADAKAWKPCPARVRQPSMEGSEDVRIYRGDCRVGSDEGESDRENCLCAERDSIGIWMQGGESNKVKTIQGKIYESFHFVPQKKR